MSWARRRCCRRCAQLKHFVGKIITIVGKIIWIFTDDNESDNEDWLTPWLKKKNHFITITFEIFSITNLPVLRALFKLFSKTFRFLKNRQKQIELKYLKSDVTDSFRSINLLKRFGGDERMRKNEKDNENNDDKEVWNNNIITLPRGVTVTESEL